MSDYVGVYKFITTLPFQSCADAQIGDIVAGVVHIDKMESTEFEKDWNFIVSQNDKFGLNDFDINKPIPGIIILKTPKHETDVVYERVLLKENQVWYPRFNVRTYTPKTILSIKGKEIHYKQPGVRVVGQVESFVEWIILTGACLTKNNRET